MRLLPLLLVVAICVAALASCASAFAGTCYFQPTAADRSTGIVTATVYCEAEE